MEIVKGPGMGIKALGLGTVEGPAVEIVEVPGTGIVDRLGMGIIEGPGMGIVERPGIESWVKGVVASCNMIGLVRHFFGSSPGPSIGCLVHFVLTMLGRFLSSSIIGGSDPA